MPDTLRASPAAAPPLLSIAIPTHQRRQWLAQSLGRILEQVAAQPAGLVEVVVCDNASVDDTWDFLQQLASEHPVLKVHRNASNIGAEGNVWQLNSLCSGDYVWVLGDDDYLVTGGLDRILERLRQGHDFLVLNFAPSDEFHQAAGSPCWAIAADRDIRTVEECLAVVPHFSMGFLSCWVARRGLFNLVDKTTYDHFRQWGLSVMADRYLMVARSGHGLVFADVLLTTRRPPSDEYPASFDYFNWFLLGSAKVMAYLLEARVITQAQRHDKEAEILARMAPRRILFERSVGKFDRPRVNRIFLDHFRHHWRYWLVCAPLMFIPGLGLLARMARPTAKP